MTADMPEADSQQEVEATTDYRLITPLQDVADGGGTVEVTFVACQEPSGKNSDACDQIAQEFARALGDVGKDQQSMTEEQREAAQARKKADPDGDKLSGQELLMMIGASTKASLPMVTKLTRQMLTRAPKLALLNGTIQFTNDLADRMTAADVQGLMGHYLVNFTLKSAVSGAVKN